MERPSRRKFAVQDWRMKVISDGDMLMVMVFVFIIFDKLMVFESVRDWGRFV